MMRFMAWVACSSLLLQASPPPAPSLPIPQIPTAILRSTLAIQDLRVFLDYDDDSTTFATWPVDKFGHRLPSDQIARAVRLGLTLWASVLPDMHFRFVNTSSEANLAIRFGDYQRGGFGGDGGRAFRPREWGELDITCGSQVESRRPDGSACSEWNHNIITLHTGRWAVKDIDFRGNHETYQDFAWIFNPGNSHYKGSAGHCGQGDKPGAIWDQNCVPFPNSPYFDSLPGCDLAAIIQHEFGHTLLGDHTPSPYECVDYARRPILSRDSCVRLGPAGFSTLFPGDGVDSWWNRRGVFQADAERLRNLGYRTSYPMAKAKILLARAGRDPVVVSDWRQAQKAMIWPLQAKALTAAQARRQLFVVDIQLE